MPINAYSCMKSAQAKAWAAWAAPPAISTMHRIFIPAGAIISDAHADVQCYCYCLVRFLDPFKPTSLVDS